MKNKSKALEERLSVKNKLFTMEEKLKVAKERIILANKLNILLAKKLKENGETFANLKFHSKSCIDMGYWAASHQNKYRFKETYIGDICKIICESEPCKQRQR